MYKFILELHEFDFNKKVNNLLKEGYKVIIGSTYITSVKTSYTKKSYTKNSKDISIIFSLVVENENEQILVTVKDNSDTFYNLVTNYLFKGYKIITGSLYIKDIKTKNLINDPRLYQEWYSCTLYKE